jgi:hypothetical protein
MAYYGYTPYQPEGNRMNLPERMKYAYPRQPAKPLRGRIDNAVTTAQWIGTFFLMCVPVVNLILLVVWALGTKAPASKSYFARAVLWMFLIFIVIPGVVLTVLAVHLLACRMDVSAAVVGTVIGLAGNIYPDFLSVRRTKKSPLPEAIFFCGPLLWERYYPSFLSSIHRGQTDLFEISSTISYSFCEIYPSFFATDASTGNWTRKHSSHSLRQDSLHLFSNHR